MDELERLPPQLRKKAFEGWLNEVINVLTLPHGDPLRFAQLMAHVEATPTLSYVLRDLQNLASGLWREQMRINRFGRCCLMTLGQARTLRHRFNDATSWRQICEVLETPLRNLKYDDYYDECETLDVRKHYEGIVVSIMKSIYTHIKANCGKPGDGRNAICEAVGKALLAPLPTYGAVKPTVEEYMQVAEVVEKDEEANVKVV